MRRFVVVAVAWEARVGRINGGRWRHVRVIVEMHQGNHLDRGGRFEQAECGALICGDGLVVGGE